MIIRVKIKIMSDDVSTVAKIILVDEEDRALFLKRSTKNKKYPGEWDLPGGHLKRNESLLDGLAREVLEETNLTVRDPIFVTKIGKTHFFKAKYDSQPIKLSKEHTAYTFLSKKSLKIKNKRNKYRKIVLMVLEKEND